MKTVSRIAVIALVFTLWAGVAHAATDFQLWLEGGLRYPLTRNLQLRFDQHLRFDNNAQSVRRIMPDIAVRYRVVRWFRVTGGYRFIIEPLDDNGTKFIDLWHRIYADALFRHRMRPVTLSYRIRFQEQFGSPRGGGGMTYIHTIRNRGKVAFDLGKGFETYIAGEFFIRINDPDGIWHKWRATAGLNYAYKAHEVGILMRGEGKLNNNNDPTLNILGLSYHYRF